MLSGIQINFWILPKFHNSLLKLWFSKTSEAQKYLSGSNSYQENIGEKLTHWLTGHMHSLCLNFVVIRSDYAHPKLCARKNENDIPLRKWCKLKKIKQSLIFFICKWMALKVILSPCWSVVEFWKIKFVELDF